MVIKNKNRGYKLIKPSKFLRRQDVPDVYDINACIYIWKRKRLLTSDNLYGSKSAIYQMKNKSSHDIDNHLDLFITKKFLMNILKKINLKNKNILIIGGSGLLGSKIIELLKDFETNIYNFDIRLIKKMRI